MRFFIIFLIVLPILLNGCATSQIKKESHSDWQKRAEAAWVSIKNDDALVTTDSLYASFAQNGMSTDSSITFIVHPQQGKELEIDNMNILYSKDKVHFEPVEDLNLELKKTPILGALRITIEGLEPNIEHFVKLEIDGKTIDLESRTAPSLESEQSSSSILLISCNEPWSRPDEEIKDELTQHPRVAPSTANSLRLLDLRANGKLPVVINGEESVKPSFMLGLGDQAYVDAEPTKTGSLAYFGGDRSDQLRIDVNSNKEWARYLDTTYRMHFLIPTFDSALKAIPNAMVWDDHEIRDGWGSQGDEKGAIPDTKSKLLWSDYFIEAKKKALEFEFIRNPNAGVINQSKKSNGEADLSRNIGEFVDSKTLNQNKSFLKDEIFTQFEWGPRVKVFMMDTRSARETSLNSIDEFKTSQQSIISAVQIKQFEKWLNLKVDDTENLKNICQINAEYQPTLYVIGLPIPLALDRENSLLMRLKEKTVDSNNRDETHDDVIDGWWWKNHSSDRNKIVSAIKLHANSCPKDRIVIVSGDVHESGLYAFFDDELRNKVYAYEIVSSGLGTLIEKIQDDNGAYLNGLNKAQLSTAITYMADGATQIGRIAGGASFAELFIDFKDDDSPPELKVLFYSNTGATDKQILKSTLVNAAPWVEQQRVWSTGVTQVDDLFKGHKERFIVTNFITPGNFAVHLNYEISPRNKKLIDDFSENYQFLMQKRYKETILGTNYGLSSASVRCEIPNSDVLESYATDWINTTKVSIGSGEDVMNLEKCW